MPRSVAPALFSRRRNLNRYFNESAEMSTPPRQRCNVLGVSIDALDLKGAVDRIGQWARLRESRYVCICNVHSVVTATRDPQVFNAIENADAATPDGAPVAWLMRATLQAPRQRRVSGPDLMEAYLREAEKRGECIGFYGSGEETLQKLKSSLLNKLPALNIGCLIAPPFRPLTHHELQGYVREINDAGVRVLFVGLGCPKQEIWMAEQRGKIGAVMVGVGAAFDFEAGTVRRAPSWMREAGLEWLHRLFSEPRRLWRRYLTTNSVFIWKGLSAIISALREKARSVG